MAFYPLNSNLNNMDLGGFIKSSSRNSVNVPTNSKEVIGVWVSRSDGSLTNLSLTGTPVKSCSFKVLDAYNDGSGIWNIGIVHAYLNGQSGTISMKSNDLGQGYTSFCNVIYK